MTVYVVTYDLNNEKNYPRLYDRLKAAGKEWCKALDSVWFIVSDATSAQLRDYLVAAIDADDTLFVSEVTANSAWRLPTSASDWLIARL